MIEISSIYGVNFLYLKEEKGRWGIEYDDLSVCEFVTEWPQARKHFLPRFSFLPLNMGRLIFIIFFY